MRSLKSGSVNSTESFVQMIEKLLLLLTTVQPIHQSQIWPNVQIIFLPPNTTSILQTMDQGVIRSLKAHYRGRVVRLLCRALEKKEPCPKISNLQPVKIPADSWEVVTKETIINCFRKAGITPTVQQAAIADSEDLYQWCRMMSQPLL